VGAPTLVLASGSPQRREILQRIGVTFTVRPTGVAELTGGDPEEVTLENARRKARAARSAAPADGAGELVLGCDTIVALAGELYGKPADESAARATLQALSGVTHTVVSGLCVIGVGGEERVALARTEVSFRELSEREVDWYVGTEEWRERAGGYAIQGAGAALVRGISGGYENVVGLPLAELLELLPELIERR
jgi:septum formation protein